MNSDSKTHEAIREAAKESVCTGRLLADDEIAIKRATALRLAEKCLLWGANDTYKLLIEALRK